MKYLTGQRLGKWTITRFDHRNDPRYYWLCQCDCGTQRVLRTEALTSGRSKSCGCSKFSKKGITGKRFDMWTVLGFDCKLGKCYYWLCRCDCGKEKSVRSEALTNGRSKSCGCNRNVKEKIIGKRFGLLTVTRKIEEVYLEGSYFYECRCDCGGTIKTTSTKILSGKIKNRDSSIHQVDDLTGQRFGKVTVTSFSHTENAKTYWNCLCDCGNRIVVKGSSLKTGNTLSCGCLKKENQIAGIEVL